MSKRIVMALGGNALGDNLDEQMVATKNAAVAIVDLIQQGNEVIVTHGNGKQVGIINTAMDELRKIQNDAPTIPLSVCVAMSQAYIGFDLQKAIREELVKRNIEKEVSTILTQVCIDQNDKAFKNPTKPIGKFMTKADAQKLIDKGNSVMEDAGRGYRRVVASPKPKEIIEIETIKALLKSSQVVIAGGGGGIPVVREGNSFKCVNAVIDKDFVSAKIAELVNADYLVILTAVEKVAINFGKENQQNLDNLTLKEATEYIKQGQFAKGSMLPKVEAAIEFVKSSKDRKALITLLEKAKDAMNGKTGTHFIND